jgi:predicted sulfurtransferase
MGKILLFYKYVDIVYPEQIRKWQHRVCSALGLKGRVIIAHEGINGTVGGNPDALELYKKEMFTHSLFTDIDFKESEGGKDFFPRMRIVVKQEITHLGLDPQKIRAADGGQHLTPEETHRLLSNPPENLVILDARNEYESRIGAFTNAIKPPIQYFREFPGFVDEHLDDFKDKEVLMYCTGGIRCERASSYLKSKNAAKKVYQIQGGIHRYAEQFPDGFFRGKNYVFDGRIAVKVNDDILSTCEHCHLPYDEFTNCINASCNKQFIVCPSCTVKTSETCSATCQTLVTEKKVTIRIKPRKVTSVHEMACDV